MLARVICKTRYGSVNSIILVARICNKALEFKIAFLIRFYNYTWDMTRLLVARLSLKSSVYSRSTAFSSSVINKKLVKRNNCNLL